MSLHREGDQVHYQSARRGAEFAASYRPTSAVYASAPGTLEHWLTERYSLYAQAPDGSLRRNDVHHARWPLQRAEADIRVITMLKPLGLTVGGPPLLHFAERVDVVVWPARPV